MASSERLTVVAQRGDSLLIVDGPSAAVYRDGRVLRFTHRDAALARGYWEEADQPLPDDLPPDLGSRLAERRQIIERREAT